MAMSEEYYTFPPYDEEITTINKKRFGLYSIEHCSASKQNKLDV
jgi:hypothetical protein